jgi:Carboxypeptidase regulatory-like domain
MRFIRITLCCIVLLMMAGRMFSQAGATGTILGTVTDSSGAVVPGAKVRVTNTSTNASSQTVTTSAGDFYVTSLNPGPYRVTVEYTGFEKSVTNAISLAVDQRFRADVSLKAGTVSETRLIPTALRYPNSSASSRSKNFP